MNVGINAIAEVLFFINSVFFFASMFFVIYINSDFFASMVFVFLYLGSFTTLVKAVTKMLY